MIELAVVDAAKSMIGLTLRNQYMELQTTELHSVKPEDRALLVIPGAMVEVIVDQNGFATDVILPDGCQYAAYNTHTP